ncbi:MAG: ester cyclase [Terriglobales bacterium]
MSSATVQSPTAQDVVSIFAKWSDAVDKGDMQAFRRLYAPDAVLYVPLSPDPIGGRDAIWQYETAMHEAFPAATLETHKPVVEHDTIAVEWTYSGRNTGPIATPMRIIPATNQLMSIRGVSFLHFKDGLITQERRYYDVRSLYQQLGLQ